MIHTLINLLAGFYESNDLSKAEAIARSIHTAIPGDQVSLKFLGIVYYRTGRIKDAIRLFDLIQCRQKTVAETPRETDPAAAAFSQEARRRVPYLAQAWQDLGSALQKMRKFDCATPSVSGAQAA